MKKKDFRNRTGARKLRFALLAFLLVPFLVGFDFPDSTGTSVSAAGGHGRYRFTPTCSQYTYSSEFTEGEVSVQHRVATAPVDPEASFWRKLKPAYLTGSADINVIQKEVTVVEYRSSGEQSGVGSVSAVPIGTQNQYSNAALSFKGGLDWRFTGLMLGINFNSYSSGETGDTRSHSGDLPSVLPVMGFRVGPENLVYLSGEAFGSRPFVSGGGFSNLGIGAKIVSTRLWVGAGSGPYEDPFFLAKVFQQLGRFSLSAAGQYPTRGSDYGFSLGLAYLLPPQR